MAPNVERDPILEAYHLWNSSGWEDCAAGCTAVTSLMRVHQMMTRRADQILAPIDLTFARYELLVRLYFREGSLPLSQLGKELQIHQTSITSLVDRLEKQGLIRRTPHPTDRRSTIAQMTPAGRVLTGKAINLLNSEFFRDLGLTGRRGAPAHRPADEDAPLLGRHREPRRLGAVRGRPGRPARRLSTPRRETLMGSTRRVIVILGAGGTLGTALSRQLAAEPDTDLVLSDLSEDALAQAPTALPPAPGPSAGEVATVPADISDFAAVENVVKHAVDRFGRLDVLISNAGVLSPNGRIHNLSTEDWERAYRVNVLGPVNGIRAAVPVMRAQRSGSIILTASVAGLTAWSHSSPYCVTKAGVIHLAKVAAVEYARDGIRVNCVCPGTFLSGMHTGLPAEAVDAIAAKHPLGLGSADDLVGAYSYLAGDASRWTTGSAIVVDGGYAALSGAASASTIARPGQPENRARHDRVRDR